MLRLRGRLVCAMMVCAGVVAATAVGSIPASGVVRDAPATSSGAGFSVSGNEILAPDGSRWAPYGVVVECAAFLTTDISSLCTGNDYTRNTGDAVIDAAANYWNANVVRLQVSQEDLFSGVAGAVNPRYAALIQSLVTRANGDGMVAILTLQEEHGGATGYAFPTASSIKFWAYIAAHYQNNPDVFFDLYNEPQLPVAAAGSEAALWKLWKLGGVAPIVLMGTGGAVGSTDITYVGMQRLVRAIRNRGATNIIIAESNDADTDLTQLRTHYLTGSNIAYGVEPNLGPGQTTDLDHYRLFGQYASAVPIMPEAFLDRYGAPNCDPNSAVDVPMLLSYLQSLDMGLIFWALDPGVGIVGSNLADPTSYADMSSFNPSLCPNLTGSQMQPKTTIGPGADIQAYFIANSVQLPSAG